MRKGFFILLLLLIFLSLVSGCTSPIVSSKTSSPNLGVGSTIIDGNLKITLNEVKAVDILKMGQYNYSPKAGTRYVILDLTFENIGQSKSVTIERGWQKAGKLYDSDGYSYDYLFTFNEMELKGGDILPGQKRRGELYYEVPVNISRVTYQYKFDSEEWAKYSIEIPSLQHVITSTETQAPSYYSTSSPPTIEVTQDTVEKLKGKLTILAPHVSSYSEVKISEVILDGISIGTVSSDSPKTVEVTCGVHKVSIIRDSGEVVGPQTVNVSFGKTSTVEFEESHGDNPFRQNELGSVINLKFGNIRVNTIDFGLIPDSCVMAGTIVVTNEGTLNTETHTIEIIAQTSGGAVSHKEMTTLAPLQSKKIYMIETVMDERLHARGEHVTQGVVIVKVDGRT